MVFSQAKQISIISFIQELYPGNKPISFYTLPFFLFNLLGSNSRFGGYKLPDYLNTQLGIRLFAECNYPPVFYIIILFWS